MRDEDAVNLVLNTLFEHCRLPRVAALSDSSDEFYDAVSALTGHKQLLHQVNDFIIPQPRGLALAEPAARGRIVAWVDGSRSCLEALQRAEPERDWLTSEIAESCGLTAVGAGVAILYRSVFLQGCRNVGGWNAETGFPDRVVLAQNIRRPRETLTDLIRRHSVLSSGVSAELASKEAERLGNAITILGKLESMLGQSVRKPGSVSPQAISSLLADLPDVPTPPSLEDVRAASRDTVLAEYRRRLLRRRRSVSRHDIELLTDCVEATLDDLHELTGISQKELPVVSLKGPAWDRLNSFVQQLASALGTSAYFGDSLGRHLGFAQSFDYVDIVTIDWPTSRERLRALDYEPVMPPQSHSPPPTTPSGDTTGQPIATAPPMRAAEMLKSSKSRPKYDPLQVREEVLVNLRAWAAQAKEKGMSSAYVFGSFVSGNGAEFDPAKSDLDLLVTFPETAANALERVRLMIALASLTSDLEVRLMRVLKTSDVEKSTVSINVVTKLELDLRIHKGGERSLYEGRFLDLLDEEAEPGSLPGGRNLDHELYRSAIAAPRGAQAYRNEFVRSTANGTPSVAPWVDDDPVPKQLARAASRLQHQVNTLEQDDEWSVNAGYLSIEGLIANRKGRDPTFAALAQKLATRRGGRGIRAPLSPEEQLLMWEVLVDEAADVLRHASSGRSATWVNLSTAAAGALSASDQAFWKTTIDMLVERLQLKHWAWFVDNAVRDLVHEDMFVAADELSMFSLAAIWPSLPERLVEATKALLSAFDEWIHFYGKNIERRPGGHHFGPDNSYRRGVFNPRFELFVDYERQWSDRCYWLLCKYIVCLNAFCHEVRQELDPSFFRVGGNFLLVDSLGTRSDGVPSFRLPTAQEVKDGIQRTPEPSPIPPPQRAEERPRPWPLPKIPKPAPSSVAKDAVKETPATTPKPRKRSAGRAGRAHTPKPGTPVKSKRRAARKQATATAKQMGPKKRKR